MNSMGVILAGGKSTRMKQDKALLTLNSTSLLQHQFTLMEKHLGKGNVIVSGDRPGFPHVKDFSADLGPIEGLRSICYHLLNQGIEGSLLVVPVDMPFISDDGLRQLILHKTALDVTKFSMQQLPAKFHNTRKVLEKIEAMKKGTKPLLPGSLSFNELFRHLDVEELVAEEDKFFTNLNTPEDWNAALS